MDKILEILRDAIDINIVPFSFPGSRLLLHRHEGKNSLFIKLAERLVSIFPGIESYLTRDPFLDELYLIDEESKPTKFEISSYPHLLVFKTKIGNFRVVFYDIDSIIILLPVHKSCGIKFKMHADNWQIFSCGGKIESYRDLYYLTNAKILSNKVTRSENICEIVLRVNKGESSFIFFSSTQPQSWSNIESHSHEELINNAEENWLLWFNKIPSTVNEKFKKKYYYAWWVLINNLLCPKGNVTHPMIVPSKKSYIGIWLWDNAFHAIALRHLDPEIARDQIRGVIAHQLSNGMLPDAIFDDGIVYEIDHPFRHNVTKPPILAWAALKIHEIDPNISFLKEIYDPLVNWNKWWILNNDSNHDGIIQYNHPYSSGMDDHPSWDYGFPVDSPDINTYLVIQMQSLSKISAILNRRIEAKIWQEKSEILVKKILDYFWDNDTGRFKSFHNNKPLSVFTILNLYPLLTGKLPLDINNRIVDCLENPEDFGGKFIIPTVSRSDSKFTPDLMWRGPIWANINYFFIEALTQLAKNDFAKKLTQKTLDLINDNLGIYEYYNANTGKPGSKAAVTFSWTAAVFIDLVIQSSNQQ